MKTHTVESRMRDAAQKVKKAIRALSEARVVLAKARENAHIESLDFSKDLICVNESIEAVLKDEIMVEAFEMRDAFEEMIKNLLTAEHALVGNALRASEITKKGSKEVSVK